MDSQQPHISLSPVSYKSTHSSRSSVLERAREYNRRIEDQKHGTPVLGIQQQHQYYHNNTGSNHSNNHYDRRRSKSLERGLLDPFGATTVTGSVATSENHGSMTGSSAAQQHYQYQQPRSRSVGRVPQQQPQQQHHMSHTNNDDDDDADQNEGFPSPSHSSPTRNRAMASVKQLQPPSATSSAYHNNINNNNNGYRSFGATPQQQQQQQQQLPTSAVTTSTKTPIKNNNTYNREPTQPQQQRYNSNSSNTLTPTTATTTTQSSGQQQNVRSHHSNTIRTNTTDHDNNNSWIPVDEKKEESHHTIMRQPSNGNNNVADNDDDDHHNNNNNHNNGPVVTPELLVDALSGHEDGLLAIAEKLMEHYDAGYDIMGEAIIDAFADVQKLFQHVVEAAHMEGAAFEAARREDEMKQRQKDGQLSLVDGSIGAAGSDNMNNNRLPVTPGSPPSNGPTRHDEFIDQDVKDVLAEAIRQGSTLRSERKDTQCYQLYTSACQDASSLLPVDSDHRGRLQLSIARAESMSPDRACAILRYAMDDVLRSGLRAHHPTPIPDPSNRADVVLHRNMTASTGNNAIVQQSPDEALASLMEELKDILQAPIYHDTPLQHVASRFWNALSESQKIQHRNEARLEQNLGKLKGEFLLARAEWEEKLSQSNVRADGYKVKYEKLLLAAQKEGFVQHRSFATTTNHNNDGTATNDDTNSSHYNNIDLASVYGSVKSAASKAETVASGVSGFAQHARSLVMNSGFNCVAPSTTGNNTKNDDGDDDGMVDSQPDSTEFDSNPSHQERYAGAPVTRGRSTHSRSRSRTKPTIQNQRFQQYSRSPHRSDI